MSSPAPLFVDSQSAFAGAMDRLRRADRIALDTEGNSFHAYVERVCLVQIAVPGEEFVIDPLAVDLRPLGQIFARETAEVVLHGADFDVRTLKRDFGFRFGRLFDTQAAARLLGRAETGLAALVKQAFGATLTKAYQKSDWGRRPLTADQISYAASDVRYLIPLRDLLASELAAQGREAKASAEFARLAGVEPRVRRFDPEGFRRIRGARELEEASLGALRELYVARERRAEESGRPPFKVVGNDVLVEVAKRLPADISGLRGIRGLTPHMVDRIGKMLIDAVRRGRSRKIA